jgi:hypothetical protein
VAACPASRYPEIVTEDVVAGVLSTRDGWLNPKVFFTVLRAKAAATGATFLTGRVVDITADIAHLPFFKDVHGLAVHAFEQGSRWGWSTSTTPAVRTSPSTTATTRTGSHRPWPSGSAGWAT